VLAVEPNIETLPQQLSQPSLTLNTLDEALGSADVVCVLVKHSPFIEAATAIRQHAKAIDAVGLLALATTRV
jgi:UDP-N-acetyl-D-mannosaminuronic acid dehydrogenase